MKNIQPNRDVQSRFHHPCLATGKTPCVNQCVPDTHPASRFTSIICDGGWPGWPITDHLTPCCSASTYPNIASPPRHLAARLKVVGMAFRKGPCVNQDCSVHQTSSCDRHPARCRLDDLRVLEYQRHSESGDDKGACQEMTEVGICAVMIVDGCAIEGVDRAQRQWYRLAGGRESGKGNGCHVSFQLP